MTNSFVDPVNEKEICKEVITSLAKPALGVFVNLLPSDAMTEEDNVTVQDMNLALQRSNDKSSPGHDAITYQMLFHLPTCAKQLLVDIMNHCLHHSSPLEEWKIIRLLYLKKNTSLQQAAAANIRPLALFSCIPQLLNCILKWRMEIHLAEEQLLPLYMNGFRKRRGTDHNLVSLFNEITSARIGGGCTTALFLDLTNAFNNVSIPTLADIMNSMNFKPYITR
ncbi:Hypothetical protein NTJ_11266 [Nesidiocoris tenuis]|uniref:Reverse transcriptase domain-containing protein n=1 Tax=Nesidiocoris tenuis TaxID=355587 RepID=A0ABN7B214_9HEMI|nr:Hypothetical protein NTJ_11266 [Nesidiocoris tenuis]